MITIKPSPEEFDLVIAAIWYEYKHRPLNLQTPTILNLAQSVASRRKRNGLHILLDTTQHCELDKIPQEQIRSVINWLELVEKILEDHSPHSYIPAKKPFTFPATIPEDPLRFVIQVYEGFDNWYAAYQFKKNLKLEDMSVKALEHIYKWVMRINEKFELNPDPEIILIEEPFKGDGLDFLEDRDIVKSYVLGYQGSDNEQEVKININVDNFVKFKPEIEQAYLKKTGKAVGPKTSGNEIKLPPNTKWEDITIKFINGNDVKIQIKNKTFLSDFKQMGFEDKKKHLPNQQWSFLEALSVKKGEITWKDSEATLKLKKRKQLLSQALKSFFHLEEDPFLPYKQEKAYKIKINLIAD